MYERSFLDVVHSPWGPISGELILQFGSALLCSLKTTSNCQVRHFSSYCSMIDKKDIENPCLKKLFTKT